MDTLRKQPGHLKAAIWERVNRAHIRKAISEFAHELIIRPMPVQALSDGWAKYTMPTDKPGVTYRFRAARRALDHWHIDVRSIKKLDGKTKQPLDALVFIIELKETLGIPDEMLPTYMEEITGTLNSLAYKEYYHNLSSDDLVTADFQTIEHAMKEGHPCFVANNGRLGFSAEEYKKYAPEADQPFRITWIAGHKSRAQFACIEQLNYQEVLGQELGPKKILEFENTLRSRGLDPQDFIFIPVHPWQWNNKISHAFSPDIANENIVFLGESSSRYSAQQSIRTLYNQSDPTKFYVKTSLSILNMGFMRGLSPYYMQSTPGITTWINELLQGDEYLNKVGFEMLSEVATAGYRNLYYEPLGKTKAHNKMLSALWRESPLTKITEGQQLMTMAALLHVDSPGKALMIEMIRASGLTPRDWIRSYLNCYLRPLLHCFYKYELVFMPHGENLILVMEGHIPVKAIMKDITEEVIVFNDRIEFSGDARRLYKETSDEMKLSYIFTDIFDCFFRFVSNILVEYGGCPESLFWEQVAHCIHHYREEHPELAAQFKRYDFFKEEFGRCCLNRLQLQNTKEMLNLADPIASLQWAGILKNPIGEFREKLKV